MGRADSAASLARCRYAWRQASRRPSTSSPPGCRATSFVSASVASSAQNTCATVCVRTLGVDIAQCDVAADPLQHCIHRPRQTPVTPHP